MTIELKFLVVFSEGALGAASTSLFEKGVGHRRLPLIYHKGYMRTAIRHFMLWEADTSHYLVGDNNET